MGSLKRDDRVTSPSRGEDDLIASLFFQGADESRLAELILAYIKYLLSKNYIFTIDGPKCLKLFQNIKRDQWGGCSGGGVDIERSRCLYYGGWVGEGR